MLLFKFVNIFVPDYYYLYLMSTYFVLIIAVHPICF